MESEEDVEQVGVYFTKKQEQAIKLLSLGSSNVEVSRTLGINEATVRKWLKNSDFFDAVCEAKQNLPAEIHGDLLKEVPQMEKTAVATLNDLMTSAKNEMVRLKAAMMVLTLRNTLSGGDKAVSITFNSMPEPGIPKAVVHNADD